MDAANDTSAASAAARQTAPVAVPTVAPAAPAAAALAPAAPVHDAPAPRNRGLFQPGGDARRRQERQQVKLSSSKQGQQVGHSRGMGQLCKAAVAGSIRGSGNFVIVSFSSAGNINYYSTSDTAGLSTEDWMRPELQRWLTSRQTGEAYVPGGGEAAGDEAAGVVAARAAPGRATWTTGLAPDASHRDGNDEIDEQPLPKRLRTAEPLPPSRETAPTSGVI